MIAKLYDTIWHFGFHLLFALERRFTTRYDPLRSGKTTFRVRRPL